MTQNLMQRWREVRQSVAGSDATRQRDVLLNHARSIIEHNLGRDWQTLNRSRYTHMSAYQLLETKRMYQTVGKEFAVAIREDDWDNALQALNQYGTRVSYRSSIEDVLNDKFQEQFFCCEDCSNYFHSDEMNSTYDGDYYVCNECLSDNYTFSDNRGTYITHDDWADEQEDDRNPEYEHIGSYHSSKHRLGHIPSSYDMRTPRVLLGLELEMEVQDDYDKDSRAGVILESISDFRDEDGIRHTYCLMEEDGSLDNGFEMVTAYTGLDVHKNQLQYFKQKTRGLTSHNTSTCGLHVHVCKSSMTTLHGAKLVLFINDPANAELVKAIARRDASGYAKFQNKKEDKHWLKDSVHSSKHKADQLCRLNSDRYEALNFRNEKTVEFRLFKGTLKYETMVSCLEFAFACWHFTASASTSELTTGKFLEFICSPNNRKDTRFLRAYLKEKGYELADNIRKGIVLTKIETVPADKAPTEICVTNISTLTYEKV
jgi:hypothetical protein